MDPKEAGVQEAEGHEAGIKRQTAKEKESEMQGVQKTFHDIHKTKTRNIFLPKAS